MDFHFTLLNCSDGGTGEFNFEQTC